MGVVRGLDDLQASRRQLASRWVRQPLRQQHAPGQFEDEEDGQPGESESADVGEKQQQREGWPEHQSRWNWAAPSGGGVQCRQQKQALACDAVVVGTGEAGAPEQSSGEDANHTLTTTAQATDVVAPNSFVSGGDADPWVIVHFVPKHATAPLAARYALQNILGVNDASLTCFIGTVEELLTLLHL